MLRTIIVVLLFCALVSKLQGVVGIEITLNGGKHHCEGIVQLIAAESTDNQSTILTACSHEFGKEEVRVLCKQLGCGQQGDRVHTSRFEFDTTDQLTTTVFPYQCVGDEESLSECSIGSSLCYLFNNNGVDIVAISCRESGSFASSIAGKPALQNFPLFLVILSFYSCFASG